MASLNGLVVNVSKIPSRKVVLLSQQKTGPVTLVITSEMVDQSAPPFVERSNTTLLLVKPLATVSLVSVV